MHEEVHASNVPCLLQLWPNLCHSYSLLFDFERKTNITWNTHRVRQLKGDPPDVARWHIPDIADEWYLKKVAIVSHFKIHQEKKRRQTERKTQQIRRKGKLKMQRIMVGVKNTFTKWKETIPEMKSQVPQYLQVDCSCEMLLSFVMTFVDKNTEPNLHWNITAC